MKKIIGILTGILLVAVIIVVILSRSGDSSESLSYKDGTYTGKSSEDDSGAYGEATVTIEDGKITDCKYITWQSDGSIKDEEYGKVNGEISNKDYYDKAQLAVNAMQQYAEELVKVQNTDEVDAVSGATISYGQFVEAVKNALEEAKE